MVLGFTGTRRNIPAPQQQALKSLLARFSLESNQLHHGCCTGADRLCHILGRRSYKYTLWPSNPEQWSWALEHQETNRDLVMKVRPPLVRNELIVEACGVLIALPSGLEVTRSGTWATIRDARRLNKTRYIIYPDGVVRVEE